MSDDTSSTGMSRGQRARLTCIECYRRKIKCDKNVPCGTCLKRGISHLCSREESVASTSTPIERNRADSEAATSDIVKGLLQRVANLEAGLGPRNHVQMPQVVQDDPTTPTGNPTADVVTDRAISPVDATISDSATVLEFLAWGRQKDVDFATSPSLESGPRQSDRSVEGGPDILTESTKTVQFDMLEALLPSKKHIRQLVSFHNESLLWYHGSYSAIIFTNYLDLFLANYGGDIRHEFLNLQWLALLFAIMTGSMTCAAQSTRYAWGFSDTEAPTLSVRWYEATVTCLNMAGYTEVHDVYAVQAIATLTIAAHILGKSNSQSVLLASAGRIAQSLGLHRLGPETLSASPEQLRKREVGRRVFIQLCTQDWFQIPFSETYTLNPRFFSTAKPLNCNDDDMVVRSQAVPTQSSYCNFRYDIAALMPQLLDAMADCNTLFTKYEQVLKYDAKMRELATASIPTFLSTNAPVAEGWPSYISWARRSLTICAAHKIIMIHRKYVGLSFTNSAFSFTRRTCIAASKTILREALATTNDNAPVLWIEQAFAIAAGIILSLDAFHRSSDEPEVLEHGQLLADAIRYLDTFTHSKIATRGVQLLIALKQELDGLVPLGSRKRAHSVHGNATSPPRKRRAFDIQALIKDVSQNLGVTPPAATGNTDTPVGAADGTWDAFNDLLPLHADFDAQYLFDDLIFSHP